MALGGLAVGGAAFNAFGQYKAGKAAKALGNINAGNIERVSEINASLVEEGTKANSEIADFNAKMAEAQARDAIRRGFESESKFRGQIRQLVSTQRVGFAGQNVNVSVGTPQQVKTDTLYQGNLDALTIRTNAAREAWGYRVDAENSRMQAESIRKTGKLQAQSVRETAAAEAISARLGGSNAASAGTFGAASTIVGAAGNLAANYYGYRNKRSTSYSAPNYDMGRG